MNLQINQPLVSITWLEERILDPNVIVLNATLPKLGQPLSEEAKTKSIPFSFDFDLKNIFKDLDASLPNTVPSPEHFSKEVQKLGVNNESTIIIYDHHGIYSSARAWWLFKVMGHQNVAVLDGGYPAWNKMHFPIDNKKAYDGPQGNFKANYQSHLISNADYVLKSLKQSDISILDARSEGRFNGTAPEPRAHLRGGHIPGSGNLPIAKIIKDGKMLPTSELKEIYGSFDLKEKLILSCGSGITACVIALGAEMAGHQNKSVYDGSWTEWGDGDSFPVEK